ncbi:MAG: ABC transporter permease [Deltaproteobacteria bacterium]|nr:ABC transporter permease [Deltaproteobacteria bacterium]
MGMTITIAWRNVWRNTRRSVLTLCAIAFATILMIFMVSMQLGGYETMIYNTVSIHTGHLQLQRKGYQEQHKIHQAIDDPQAYMKTIQSVAGVDAITPRVKAFALASTQKATYGCLIIGIDPESEARVSTLARVIQEGRYLTPGDSDGALLGRILAQNLGARVGDELVILGQGMDGSTAAAILRVQGIYRSGMDEFDRSVVNIPIETAEDVFSTRGKVHEIVITTKDFSGLTRLARAIRKRLSSLPGADKLVVLTWDQVLPGLKQGIQLDMISGWIFYMILILVVAFGTLNTFLMAILERTREFGVMMAMGCAKKRIVVMILAETVVLTGLGLIIGIVLGCGVTYYYQVHGIVFEEIADVMGQWGLPPEIRPRLSLISIVLGPLIISGISFLVGLYPAWRVRSLHAASALKTW